MPRLLLVFLLLVVAGPGRAAPPRSFDRWEKAIRAFEKQDREKPPPRNAVLFAGSSSIRLWDLPKSFPGLDVINRGFGGSEIADSTHFAPRIILKHRPRVVVLYAGDNDLANGKTPERVLADFKAFVETVHKELPDTRILYLSIKPSIRRWALIEKIRKANGLIEARCKEDRRLRYVDVAALMLGKDGKPRPELFAADGLHLNATGYQLWASVLRPYLK